MPEKRRQYEQEFKEGAVRIVRESGKSIAEIARDLDINAGTLGNWVARDRGEGEGAQGLSTDDVAELKRLRSENAQLRMERDVLKRSVALWVSSRVRANPHYVEGRIMSSVVLDCLRGKGSAHLKKACRVGRARSRRRSDADTARRIDAADPIRETAADQPAAA